MTEIDRLSPEHYPGLALYRARCSRCPEQYDRYFESDSDARVFMRGAMRTHIAETGHEVVIERVDPWAEGRPWEDAR